MEAEPRFALEYYSPVAASLSEWTNLHCLTRRCENSAGCPASKWNHEEISCQGRRVKVTLNGVVIVDANLDY